MLRMSLVGNLVRNKFTVEVEALFAHLTFKPLFFMGVSMMLQGKWVVKCLVAYFAVNDTMFFLVMCREITGT